jgi:hypothetical protein
VGSGRESFLARYARDGDIVREVVSQFDCGGRTISLPANRSPLLD